MVGEQPEQLSNGQVIGVAGGVAAALAAILIARERSRRNGYVRHDAAPEQLHRGMDVAWHAGKEAGRRASAELAAARERTKDVDAPFLEPLKESAEAALDAGRKQSKRLSKTIAEHDPEKFLSQTASAIAKKREPIQHQARVIAEHSVERGGELTHKLGEQAATLAHRIRDQAEEVSETGFDRALEVGESLVDTAKDRLPTITHKVSEDVMPTLRGLAVTGAATAAELWDVARERAAAAAEAAQDDGAKDARHLLDFGSKRAKAASSDLAHRADKLKVPGKQKARFKSGASDRAKDVSRTAVDATVETSRDTGAMLVWAGLAAALVYYGLLSPERRQQVDKAVSAVINETRELIQDIQGYDEEF